MNRFTRWQTWSAVFSSGALLLLGACTDDQERAPLDPQFQVIGAGSGNLDWTCDLSAYQNECTLPSGAPANQQAKFFQGSGPSSAGTGVFGPLVRIATNDPLEEGYNTSARPVQFDENTDPNHTISVPLNAIPVIERGGIFYREFNLDINQSGSQPGLSLDEIYIYLSTDSLIGGPSNFATVRACDFGKPGEAQLVWALDGDMDNGSGTEIDCLSTPFEDQWILLNYVLEGGSGNQDMTMWVPDSFFETTLAGGVGGVDDCPYDGGVGRCGLWIYFYSHFGGAVSPPGTSIDWPPTGQNKNQAPQFNGANDFTTVINNANFEEWNYVLRPYITAEKTAVPTYDVRHLWDIEKLVDGQTAVSCSVFPGENCPDNPFDYTVEAQYMGADTFNYAVSGQITIENPSDEDVYVTGVSDVITEPEPDIYPPVDCGAAFPILLEAGGTLICTYSVGIPDADAPPMGTALTNFVQVSIQDMEGNGLGGANDTQKFAFSSTADTTDTEATGPDNVTSCLYGDTSTCTPGDSITLSDDYATPTVTEDDLPVNCGTQGTCNTSDWTAFAPDSATFTYSRNFSCGAEQGGQTLTFENIAIINVLARTDTATVTVNCLEFASKAGTKYHDLNANGQRDAGEPGLADWEINLVGTDLDGAPVNRKDTTDSNGDYLFDNLKPGTYTVTETQKSGWVCSFPNAGASDANTYGVVTSTDCDYDITLVSGEDDTGNDFGNWTPATKSGMKFNDLNADGVKDGGEPGLEDWVIYVDYDNSGTMDAGEPRDTTASDGTYQITGIDPGTWYVREEGQSGWTCSYPNAGSGDANATTGAVTSTACYHQETFNSDDDLTENDFGNWQTASKTGKKFHDLNANGADDSEPGLGDWVIYVDYDNSGTMDAGEPRDTTASDGTYQIDGIAPGTWYVREEGQSGWTCSFPNAGGGDADATTGAVTSSACYHQDTFTSGMTEANNDFGNWTTATKAGTKFHDLNADGTKDGGESGLQDWVIYVDYDNSGTMDAGEPRDTTASDGTYLITGIVPGMWYVREEGQSGWTCSFPNAGAGDADTYGVVTSSACYHQETFDSNEDETGNDFGNWTTATKAGTKFHDLNANGADDSEPGLGGWVIYVDYDNSGTMDAGEPRDTTASDGTYLITGINPGTWYVREEGQSGWTCSFPNAGAGDADTYGVVTSSACYHQETFDSNEDETGNDFGNWTTATKAGKKFHDLNANGADDSEPGLGGWVIYVDYDNSGTMDAGEPRDTTASDGTYLITGINPGTWYVREEGQSDWFCSYPNPCYHQETFDSDDDLTGNNFGNWQYASKSGFKFSDLDNDGVWDAGEPGLENWTIQLFQGGSQIDQTLTGADGSYLFDDLMPGDYVVCEVMQTDWTQTFPTSGFACSNGTVGHSFTLISQENEQNNNFGNYMPQNEETAFALGDPYEMCFIPTFENWGWTNGPIGAGSYEWEVWAGAADCNTDNGEMVGTVEFTYTEGLQNPITYTWHLNPGITLESEHVYAGTTQFPQKNGSNTVSPGQYYITEYLTGNIYVIFHAVVVY